MLDFQFVADLIPAPTNGFQPSTQAEQVPCNAAGKTGKSIVRSISVQCCFLHPVLTIMTVAERIRHPRKTATAAPAIASERINLRASVAAKQVIARAAASLGTTVSAFMVQSAYETAQRLVSQQELLTVSAADFAAFARAMEKPAKPNATLKRLMR